MKLPVIIVNFKAYEEATGERAFAMARVLERVTRESSVEVCIAASPLDVGALLRETNIPIFAQHVDGVGFGSKTGQIPAVVAKNAGVSGTLLNHAERRLSSEVLAKTITMCRELGLYTVVCAESPEKVTEIVGYQPDAIAYEPPELIGGTVSVSTAQPEIISKVVQLAGEIPLLVGAGVKTAEDVRVAMDLGAQGVLLASGVVLSPEPEAVLYDLIEGFSL